MTLPDLYSDALDGPWRAFAIGDDGDRLSDEEVADRITHADDATYPRINVLRVARGDALPTPEGRLPSTTGEVNLLVEFEADTEYMEPEFVAARWEQATTVAAALNMAARVNAKHLREAIGDPGSVVGGRLDTSWPEGHEAHVDHECEVESVSAWGARAVLAVLQGKSRRHV